MSQSKKSDMEIFEEGIRARTNGDAPDANPYPIGGRDREAWLEGWRIYDVLRETPPTDADILDRLARGDRQAH
jgi:ribosome modulation factor